MPDAGHHAEMLPFVNYYLMCFNLKWGNITNYRVDCMADVRMEEENIETDEPWEWVTDEEAEEE